MFDYRNLATPEEEEWFSKLSLEEKVKIEVNLDLATYPGNDFTKLTFDTMSDKGREKAIELFKKRIEEEGMPTLARIRFESQLYANNHLNLS